MFAKRWRDLLENLPIDLTCIHLHTSNKYTIVTISVPLRFLKPQRLIIDPNPSVCHESANRLSTSVCRSYSISLIKGGNELDCVAVFLMSFALVLMFATDNQHFNWRKAHHAWYSMIYLQHLRILNSETWVILQRLRVLTINTSVSAWILLRLKMYRRQPVQLCTTTKPG